MPPPLDPEIRLADSPSPFLRHGATQPVNWLPWSESVFARARWENRPVLLDIGAVWCHWCHVMDRESYEDPETARLINELYIPIKVDRDERPDIDARYQRAVQSLTGLGGWPLTAFLTPGGEVFYGGFGGAPKFPQVGALQLLLDRSLDDDSESPAHRILTTTLHGMARGGIHDHLGGGFHRYSVDARWLVPHFEKMAYDNGPLLEVYARAAAALGEPFYRQVAEGVVAYYREVAPALNEAGGFPASQDADLGPGDDGSYWTWTRAEIEAALGGDERSVRAAVLRYGLDDPRAEAHGAPGRQVLHLAAEPAAIAAALGIEPGEAEGLLDEVTRRLRAARDRRPRPFVDESLYAGWIALVASGHLAAARHLGLPGAGESALRALDRVWAEAFDAEAGVAHRLGDPEGGGFLEDQAYFAQALVDAFEWTQRPEYLTRARQVVDLMLGRFLEPGSGALADRPRGAGDDTGLLATPYLPIVDAPAPSGNASAALVLLQLAWLVDEPAYRRRADAILSAFAGGAGEDPIAHASYLRAVDWATAPVTTVVIVGGRGTEADEMLRTALATYRPRMVVRWLERGELAEGGGATPLTALPAEVQAMVTGEAPRAYLCVGQSCAPPVTTAAGLRGLLGGSRG